MRLLGDGRLYAANEKLEKIDDMYFPVIKIIRKEVENTRYEYKTGEKVQIFLNGSLCKEVLKEEFSREADYLFNVILNAKTTTFVAEKSKEFLNGIGVTVLKAKSKDKTDIRMKIHDIQTGYEPVCGFSIKSNLGSAATLLNSGDATNFIYRIKNLSEEKIDFITKMQEERKHSLVYLRPDKKRCF